MIFKSTLFAACLAVVGLSVCDMTTVDAHADVTISRGRKCREGLNTGCGQIQYEPWSLEYTKGYPGSGPPDGQLGAAGHPRAPGTGGTPGIDFTPLNAQTSDRWHKTPASAGSQIQFVWRYNAVHRSNGYKYFITRNGWNQNAPLTRASFESTPFCSVPGNGSMPPTLVTNTCTIPSDRSGYHIVMAIWEVADTSEAFYNMIDLQVSGGNAPAPSPTASPPSGGGTLGDWQICSTSTQCANGCCSGQYSDGVLKCTPLNNGFDPSVCVSGGAAPAPAPAPSPTASAPSGGGALGDWQTCSTSTQCANGCCSGQYSDGVLKCTPLDNGFDSSICVGSTPTGNRLGDWEMCSVSSQCANGCCSGQYSGGVLKCTPLNNGFNPSICVSGRRGLRGSNSTSMVDVVDVVDI